MRRGVQNDKSPGVVGRPILLQVQKEEEAFLQQTAL